MGGIESHPGRSLTDTELPISSVREMSIRIYRADRLAGDLSEADCPLPT